MIRTCTVFVLMLLLCGTAAADNWASFETYSKPKAFVVRGKAHLLVQVNDGQESSSAVFREDPSGWTRLAEFNADYSAMALNGSRLLLFLRKSVIEIDTRHWHKVNERRWPFNWRPQSVEIVEGDMAAFGVGSDDRIYSAVLIRRGGNSSSEPTLEHATSTAAAPATNEQNSDEWHEILLQPGYPNCTSVRTIQSGGSIWIFWTTLSEYGLQDLRSARLDGFELRDETLVQTVRGKPQTAAVNFNGEPAIIYAVAEEGNPPSMLFRRNISGRWTPLVEVQDITGGNFESIVGMEAAIFNNEIHAFLATDFRILRLVYDGVTWSDSKAILSHPAVTFTLENTRLIFAGAGIAVVLLFVSFIRSRFLPARAIIGGFDYVLAPFWRRAGAYLFDLAVVIGIIVLLHQITGQAPSRAGIMAMIFSVELLYFSLSEGRSGKTFGKRLFGIFVISRNGGYSSIGEAFIRNLSRAVVDAMMLSPLGWLTGALFILNSKGSQRVGDIIAGTYVVKERPEK